MGGLWRDYPATAQQEAMAAAAPPSASPSGEKPKRTTQADLLIALMRARRAERKALELPEIRNLGIYQHTARFFEIRERGFVVDNEMEHAADGTVHSRYWLRFDPERDGAQ